MSDMRGRVHWIFLAACLAAAAGCRTREETAGRPGGGDQPAAAVREDSLDRETGEAAEALGAEVGANANAESRRQSESQVMAERSGIEGLVTIGPACPVAEEGRPCPDRPYRAQISVRDAHSDRVVTTFTSGEDGRFRVDLPPGGYILDPGEPRLLTDPRAGKVVVTVESGRYSYVVVRFDSGVR